MIMRVNSSAISTVEASRAEGAITPAPPVLAVLMVAVPDRVVSWYTLPDCSIKPLALAKVTSGIWFRLRVSPLSNNAATTPSAAADGVVAALFDNGETRNLNQIPLVTFANANGLIEQSGNVYQETTRSGTATIKTANTGGAGVIAPSALEASTVDIADEFTRMIITQRAFSANTRVVTTGDEMLDELVRIVR